MKTKDVIGVALDLSLEMFDGARIDSVIKKQLRDFHRELNDFIFYLYDPEVTEIKSQHFSSHLNDFVLPRPFNYFTALDQSLTCVTDDADSSVLIVITNRYLGEQRCFYQSMFRKNLKRDLNCNVILVGVGDNYDKDDFSSLSSVSPVCKFVHLDLNELSELKNVLLFSLNMSIPEIASNQKVLLEEAFGAWDETDDLEAPSEVVISVPISQLGFNTSGGLNVSKDVETDVKVELQDKVYCEVGEVSLKTEGCAKTVVTHAKKSTMKIPRKRKKKNISGNFKAKSH